MASQGGKSMRQSRGETLTTSYTSRVTKGGRKLNYQLSVIQQPERARACGSGAKSSADRRPVDPPPVVELRIFDGGDKGEQDGGEDVTFAYNANFFLFATLEVSRPILSGRVQAAPSNQPPVLTGMPVSGMAYLDRPKEAGYFIFPDLSVRHEGRYKLSFNLYEETKEEKDTDAEPAENKPKGLSGPGTPDSSFDWRLEVKSSEFTVFSAKKFPGLTESTSLSRTVAEQGCRVRIRRDVRMRRRDGKADGFDETTAQEDEYARVGRSHEQEDYHRSRSNSGASPDGRSPYPDSPYHQQGPPHNGFNGQGPPSNLQWLGQHQGQQPFAQPQMPSQPQYQAPPHNPYHQEQQQYRHVAPQHPRPATDPYQRAHPQSAFPSESPRPPREFEQIRRQSVPVNNYGPAPNPHFNGHYSDPNQNHAPFTPYVTSRPKSPPMAAQYSLPPMHGSVPTEPKHERPPGTVLPTVDNLMNTRQPYSPTFERVQERAAPSYGSSNIHSGPITAAIPVAVEPNRNGSKRPYDSVFRSSISNEALHNGMRPSSPHDDEDDDEDFIARAKMVYKRADGSHMDRQIPPPTRD